MFSVREIEICGGKRVSTFLNLCANNTKMEVCGVTQDETTTEEKSYGENGVRKHILCKVHLLCTIDEAHCPFEYTRTGCLKRDMVRLYAKTLMLSGEYVLQSRGWKVMREMGCLKMRVLYRNCCR
jgi:hypothetical protein